MAVTTTSLSILDGTGASKSIATVTDPAGLQRSVVSIDTPGVASYRVAASFTPFGTADRTIISIKGSATKTVRVKRILVTGVATANGSNLSILSRTTALGSGGTSVAPTIAKMDSGTVAAATAVVAHYTTAAQTLGAGPTTLWEGRLYLGVTAVPTVSVPLQAFPESGMGGSALVLRGVADFLEFGIVAGNITAGAVVDYAVEWEEDGS